MSILREVRGELPENFLASTLGLAVQFRFDLADLIVLRGILLANVVRPRTKPRSDVPAPRDRREIINPTKEIVPRRWQRPSAVCMARFCDASGSRCGKGNPSQHHEGGPSEHHGERGPALDLADVSDTDGGQD